MGNIDGIIWLRVMYHLNKINLFATSCYRVLLGVRRSDKTPNDVILAAVHMQPLINIIHQPQLGCLGHVLRRHEREPARILALYTSEHGKTGRGKLSTKYLKQTASFLSSTPEHVTADHIAKWANNKQEWHDSTAAYCLGGDD